MMNSAFLPRILSAACVAAVLSAPAYGCGACDEDKIAATYDHATVMKAAATHRVVVFGAIEGTANPARATRELDSAGSRVKGVQTGSVRTSSAPAAFSFVLDPHSQSPDQAVRELQRRLAPTGVKLALIRVLP